MKIDGREIAKNIFLELSNKVTTLQEKGITPHLAIILVGNDPASESYVRQKELKAANIGAKTTLIRFPQTVTEEELIKKIKQLNNDNNIHGIIVQRPLPPYIDGNAINILTDPKKDIDAFHPATTFTMPLAAAVIKVLEEIHKLDTHNPDFLSWIQSKNIVVIGKGETGGGPVITKLKELGAKPLVIDSKTQNPKELTKNADIIISATGRPNILNSSMIKKGVILIAVGMYRGEDEKMHGDYQENDIIDVASYYTPVPGGIGPVNVAMLLKNLVKAAEKC